MTTEEKALTLGNLILAHETATQALTDLRAKSARWQETLKYVSDALNSQGYFIDFSQTATSLLKAHGLPPHLEPYPTLEEVIAHVEQINSTANTISAVERKMREKGWDAYIPKADQKEV